MKICTAGMLSVGFVVAVYAHTAFGVVVSRAKLLEDRNIICFEATVMAMVGVVKNKAAATRFFILLANRIRRPFV